MKEVHKIWHKSMNHKRKNQIFEKYCFLDTGTNSSSRVPAERLPKTRSNFSQSVMVSVAVSSLESMELVFVEPGVKVDGAYGIIVMFC